MKLIADIAKILKIVKPKRALGIQLLICLNTFAEVAIIAVIPFYLSLLSNPTLRENTFKAKFFTLFHLVNGNEVDLQNTGLFLFVVIVLANLFLIFSNYVYLKFCASLGAEFSDAMFKYYLSRDYGFFLKTNSAEIVNDILNESLRLHGNIVMPFFLLISRLLFLTMIMTGLFIVSAKATLVIICFILIYYFLFYKVTKKILLRNSKIVTNDSIVRYKTLAEAFDLIKELKIYRKYDSFIEKQKNAHLKINYGNAQNEVLGGVSRYFFETFLFGSGCAVIYYISYTGMDLKSVLPALSLYFVSAYKTVPAAHQIFSSFSHLRTHVHVLDKTGSKLLLGHQASWSRSDLNLEKRIKLSHQIEFKNICFSYDGKVDQIRNLNMKIPIGKKVAFVGASGAGKTTVANMLLGLIQPSRGQILVDGNVTDLKSDAWIQNISFIPQIINLMDESIESNITFFENDLEGAQKAAQKANILPFIQSLPLQFNTLAGDNGVRLSGGQKQRIGLARALYFDRPLIILDEATSALDNANEYEVMRNIDSIQNKTIIVIAHRLSTIRGCDVIYLFDDGQVIDSGTFSELKMRNKYFEDLVAKNGAALQ